MFRHITVFIGVEYYRKENWIWVRTEGIFYYLNLLYHRINNYATHHFLIALRKWPEWTQVLILKSYSNIRTLSCNSFFNSVRMTVVGLLKAWTIYSNTLNQDTTIFILKAVMWILKASTLFKGKPTHWNL